MEEEKAAVEAKKVEKEQKKVEEVGVMVGYGKSEAG